MWFGHSKRFIYSKMWYNSCLLYGIMNLLVKIWIFILKYPIYITRNNFLLGTRYTLLSTCYQIILWKNSVFKFIPTAHIICIFDELPCHHFSFKHFTSSFVYSSFSNYTATKRIFLETKRKLKYRTPNLTIKPLKINLMSFRDFNGFVSPNRLN